ncbi:MAG TPA: hypothetical protein VE338_18345 [Ktedonobacterales bacterium]|jgi:hypothetical protein|nr:hypothetical protein [Ktedonobacterales bacterium]
MIKRFTRERSCPSLTTAAWLTNPRETSTLFSRRKPLRKLRALVGAELINGIDGAASGETGGNGTCEKPLDRVTLLRAPLGSDVIEWHRYRDGGPPSDIDPVELAPLTSRYPVYAGWAVAYPDDQEQPSQHGQLGIGHWFVLSQAHACTQNVEARAKGYSNISVPGAMIEFARQDTSPSQSTATWSNARNGTLDMLALQVADRALDAGIYVSDRPYLHSGSAIVSRANVATCCTLAEAIPLIALYLRAQDEFLLLTGAPDVEHRVNRGLYFGVGTCQSTDELACPMVR